MPEPVDLGYAATLPNEAAIAYFRSKGYVLTWSWRDMAEEAHALAFTVAKSAGFDVLGDIKGALETALAEGQTFRTFANDELVNTLRRKGWWGRRFDPETGEAVQLGSYRRLKTIFTTNIRTARAAARYQAMKANARARPYWMYDAVNDSRTRPSHAALDNLVFRHDDPFWQTHFPPNGFNCRCVVRALTRNEVRNRGLEVLRSEGRIQRVDQDFGGRQTWTMGYDPPGAGRREMLIPDPGFGRRPFPGLAIDAGLIERMRRAFDLPVDEAIASGRGLARRVAAIGPDEARAIFSAADEPILAVAIERARRREILRMIEERRGPGLEATNIRALGGRKAAALARRMRELTRLLPADWVRRANLGPGVTVKAAGRSERWAGSYSAQHKHIDIYSNADDSTLLHEYVHHLQEMHPDLDGLFYAFHRRQTRVRRGGAGTYRFREYAEREYDYRSSPTNFGSSVGGVEAMGRARYGVRRRAADEAGLYGHPRELMTTALQSILTGWPPGSLDLMIRHDLELFEFVLGLLRSGP